MSTTFHDPRERIRGIHQILISDKKRIGFLFGAGTSFATGIPNVSVPAIESMTELIVGKAGGHSKKFANAMKTIAEEIGREHFNIESLLSCIETKLSVVGKGNLNGLVASDLLELSNIVKSHIVELVSIHSNLPKDQRNQLAHCHLANWISKARRRYPAEIFTTNYDFLFEMALEDLGEPYFDGFSGSFEPFFCTEAVEDIDAYPKLVKLWKMHGSLGWTFRDSDKAVIRNNNAPAESILIYPSHLKYNNSKKQPYIGLIDRLCTFLQQDDAVLITCGYSFGDDHINERIATSLRRGTNSHVVALYFDEFENTEGTREYRLRDENNHVHRMAKYGTGGKMSAFGVRHAIIGGKFAPWRLRDEPRVDDSLLVGQFFDEDAAVPPGNRDGQGDEVWTGEGRFLLPDFRRLSKFLDELALEEKFVVAGTNE